MFVHALIPIVAMVKRIIRKILRFLFRARLSHIMERARLRALRILGDQDDADEAVARAMYRIVRRPHKPERFESYLLCAVRNAALDILRQRARRQATSVNIVSVADELEDHSPSAPAQAATAQEASMLHDALTKLKWVERDAVVLHYFQGLSIPDTAQRLGVELYTAQNVLARARRELGRILRPKLS
jgi:RNA polymerase sigma-70 factor, ECF subfamily